MAHRMGQGSAQKRGPLNHRRCGSLKNRAIWFINVNHYRLSFRLLGENRFFTRHCVQSKGPDLLSATMVRWNQNLWACAKSESTPQPQGEAGLQCHGAIRNSSRMDKENSENSHRKVVLCCCVIQKHNLVCLCWLFLSVFVGCFCWLFLLLFLFIDSMLIAQLQLVRHKNCIESVPVACNMGCQKPWFDIGFLHVSGSDLLWVIMGYYSQHGWLWSNPWSTQTSSDILPPSFTYCCWSRY